MAFNIEEFKAQGVNMGGARNTQFMVAITPPPALGVANARKLQFVCKAAQLPPAITSPIEVAYFGRKVKFVGDREFPDWTVTIYNDEDFYCKKMMEKWSNGMNTLISNVMDTSLHPTGYKASAIVHQFAKHNEIVASYRLEGLFPIQVDAIPLDWEAVNQIEMFDVTFAYDYWVPESVALASDVDYTATTGQDGVQESRNRVNTF